jgi:ribonuclease BN (tRNA processing enzyme)
MMSEPGKITERITLLGTPEICFYHVDGGGESALIGGGMAYLAPLVLPQVRAFGIDAKKIRHLVILHTHFDHCGLVPYLKKLWPWMKVAASAQGKSRLSDPRVTQNIAAFNQMADAAGVQYRNFVFAAGNSNYDLYQESLQRMARYTVEVVLLEHYGAAVGEEAKAFLPNAIKAAENTRALIEKSCRLTGDTDKTTQEITRFVFEQSPDYFLDKEVLSMVIAQMVKFIAKALEEKEGMRRSA